MKQALQIGFAIAALAAVAFGADNTTGTWKFDAAKSKGATGVSPIKTLMVTREDTGDMVTTSGKGEREDGSKIGFSYSAKFDGRDVAVTGAGLPYDTIALKQVNDNTVTSVNSKKGSSYKANARFVVSNGGKTATLTIKGTGADGKPFTSVSVYQKQ